MPALVINSDSIKIKLSPLQKILSLSGDITIPAANILGAYKAERGFRWGLGLRIGTEVPGLLYAGHFASRRGLVFCYWGKGQQPLAINLTGNLPGFKYRQVIIGTDDAQALADDINERITAC